MRLAEPLAADATAAIDWTDADVVAARVCGWGGGPRARVSVWRAASVDRLRETLTTGGARPMIARGMGRSYGDAAQLTGGLVVDTSALRGIELDAPTGTVTTGAGVTLRELIAYLQPRGWALPVVPGTQHVTVGGAVACDIHGKNHSAAGTFGSHVRALGLLTADGELMELSHDRQADVLHATLGGMGLTGIVVWVRIDVRRVAGPWLAVDVERAESLEAVLGALDAAGGSYRVAWLDLLGRPPVRGVVTSAEHVPQGPSRARATASMTVASALRVPPRWPGGLLQPAVVRAYNEYRYRRSPPRALGRLEPYGSHMFPLDALDAWPRLYGRAGLVQYQFVVPRGAERALERAIEMLRRSRVPCLLAVLKDFGPANDSPLSFPLAGWTLALDMPAAVTGLPALLERFDELVAGAGGRVYLAKDSRLRAERLEAMYPRLGEWRRVRDGVDPEHRWRSDLAVRTGLVGR